MPRLDELLSRSLGVSKTAVARLVAEERVSDLAGTVIRDRKQFVHAAAATGLGSPSPSTTPQPSPDTLAEAGAAVVLVDGRPTALFDRALILLHKPTGVVTALRDLRHPTAYALLREAPLFAELRPVGRLDVETSGLLLWTTVGPLVSRLTHPKRRIPRTYHAALTSAFSPPGDNFVLSDGHRPEIAQLATLPPEQAHPALAHPPETRALASITIVGGAYHEVRRIFAALGSHVVGLCRTQFGIYRLPPDLAPGNWLAIDCPQP